MSGIAAAGNFCDTRAFPYVDYTQIDAVQYVFVILYVLVIFFSIAGNGLVIYTVFRNKHMRTVTNYYIVNLAASDLLVAVLVMPLKLLEYVAPCSWLVFSKDSLCAFLYFTLPVFVFTSVLTLVAISLERFYAVVYPLNSRMIHSKSRTRKIIVTTWAIAVVFAIPYLFCKSYAFNIESDLGTVSRQICTDRFDYIDEAMYGAAHKHSGRFRKGFFLFLFFAMYTIPSCLILFTCIRMTICLLRPIDKKHALGQKRNEENKRKVARMIIIVATTFIVSWSPFYMVSLISQVQQKSFLRRSNFLFTMLSTHLVGFVNSVINPFLYISLSDKFRSSFKEILKNVADSICCIFCCGRRRREQEVRCRAGNIGITVQPSPPRSSAEDKALGKAGTPKLMRGSWHTRALRRPCLFHCAMRRSGRRTSSDCSSPELANTTVMTLESSALDSHKLAAATLHASAPGPRVTTDNFLNLSPRDNDAFLGDERIVNVIVNPNTDSPECQERLLGNGYVVSSSAEEDDGRHGTDYLQLNHTKSATKNISAAKGKARGFLKDKRFWSQVSDVPVSNLHPTRSSNSLDVFMADDDVIHHVTPRLWENGKDKCMNTSLSAGEGAEWTKMVPALPGTCKSLVSFEAVTSV